MNEKRIPVSCNRGCGATNRDNPNFCTSSEPTKPSNGSRTHTVFVQVEKRGKGG